MYAAAGLPVTAQRIGIITHQRIHAVLEQAIFYRPRRCGSEIDHPLPVDVMQFWRPDQRAKRAGIRFVPHRYRFCLNQASQR